MGKSLSFQPYVAAGFDFAGFPPGARVLDLGCGEGRFLRALKQRGCRPVGIDVDPKLVDALRAEGFEVALGGGEQLAFPAESLDGIVCSVVLPYTDERKVVREWGRVLQPGGVVKLSAHGSGYALRQLLRGESFAMRVYAIRSLVNTWVYRLFGRRLPGWIGDTLLQSDRRLRRYYRKAGLQLRAAPASPRYLGLPVFIYHEVVKPGAPSAAGSGSPAVAG